MDKVQLFIEIFTFIVLVVALFVNVDYAAHKKSAWANFKILAIAASIVGLIVYFRILAQYSFLFLIIGILSIGKRNNRDGTKQNLKVNN